MVVNCCCLWQLWPLFCHPSLHRHHQPEEAGAQHRILPSWSMLISKKLVSPISIRKNILLNFQHLSFTITAVFFNIGVNEKATLAEALGETTPQYHSNSDNLDRLNKYYHKYSKIFPTDHMAASRGMFEYFTTFFKTPIDKKTSHGTYFGFVCSVTATLPDSPAANVLQLTYFTCIFSIIKNKTTWRSNGNSEDMCS